MRTRKALEGVSPRTLRRLSELAQKLRRDPSDTRALADAKDIDVLTDELRRGRFAHAEEQVRAMDTAARDALVDVIPTTLLRRLGYERLR